MDIKPSVMILIPAYNEEKTIGAILKRVKDQNKEYEILVIDDGSIDNTNQICLHEQARVTRHPHRKGNGAAIKSGITNSRREIIVVLDADDQYDVDDIPRFLEAISQADLVVGVRNSHSKETIICKTGNKILSKISTYLSERKIPDLTCGFRAFKREKIAEFISLLPDGFSLPATSTMAFINSGYNVEFIPVKMSLNPLQDGFRFLMIILKITTLFSPLKIFLPFACVLWAMAAIDAAAGIMISHVMPGTAIILFISGVVIFFLGFLAE